MKLFKIAVIPGDGIGKEVIEASQQILNVVIEKYNIKMKFDYFDFSSCDYYLKNGKMLPDNWKDILCNYDAIFFGAVGWPEKVPDHISLWGSLIQFRREFDQYINLRPVKLFKGINCPLKGKKEGDIDFIIVRENTEGEYSSIGGRMFSNTDREFVIQETILTKVGVDRVVNYAFELAQKRKRKMLTSATKSNGISISMPYWDERVSEISKNYKDVSLNKYHIDILCAQFVLNPEQFDVIVGSNLFGDILSDLGPACTGTIGIAPSANINPEKNFPSLFEPVHGSAPDITGKGVANPIGQIWAAALMLEHLGLTKEGKKIISAIEKTLQNKKYLTKDLGGNAYTQDCTDGIKHFLINEK